MTGVTGKDIAAMTGGTLAGEGDEPVTGAAIDSRMVRPGDLFAALSGERADGHDYMARAFAAGAACCLATHIPEGVSGSVVLVPDVEKAMADLAAAYRGTKNIPVIGVTGSVGKTTTKEMIASVLSQRYNTLKTEKNLNNQLGVPLTLLRLGEEHQAAVVELGISHFGEMRELARMAMPTMAVYTVIGRAHLEFLHDRDGVLQAKGELLEVMSPDATVFVNGDDDKLSALTCRQEKLTYGLGESCHVRAEEVTALPEGGTRFVLNGMGVRVPVVVNAYGGHLVYAALAAACVGLTLGLTANEVAAGIGAYESVGRRASAIETPCLRIVDDCYNSNPDSCAAAIQSAAALGGRLVCILGDMLELGDTSAALHAQTGALARERGALLLTVGELSKHMGGTHFDTKEELIAALPRLLQQGDTVLVKASHSMAFEQVSEYLKTLTL